MKHAIWLTPIVVVAKKNGKVRVCEDCWKFNTRMETNVFPLTFTDGVLDVVAGHKVYSFLGRIQWIQ